MTNRPKYHLDSIFNPNDSHPNDAHSILMRMIPDKTRVLELGCASGYLSGYMEQVKYCKVTGLEADPDSVKIAATRCSEVYQVDLDSPDALSAVTGEYDVLLAAAVLEHLKHAESLLQLVKPKLKPGALVIVSLPNVAHWSARLKLLLGRFDYADYGVMDRTHLHFYTMRTGRQLLENHGYQVESVSIAGSGLQAWADALCCGLKLQLPPPLLPGLLGYELIYRARLR